MRPRDPVRSSRRVTEHIGPDRRERGTALLLAHCDVVGRLTAPAPQPAFERLGGALGPGPRATARRGAQASASRP